MKYLLCEDCAAVEKTNTEKIMALNLEDYRDIPEELLMTPWVNLCDECSWKFLKMSATMQDKVKDVLDKLNGLE